MLERRMLRLRSSDGRFRILALDHGLTKGVCNEAPSFSAVEKWGVASQDYLSGVVLCPGMVDRFQRVPVVLQCFGGMQGCQKVRIATIADAIRGDAAAVSVQLDYSSPRIEDALSSVCAFISDAHEFRFPVLAMLAGFDTQSPDSISSAIRRAVELGVDIVKIPCQVNGNSTSLRESLTSFVPVVYAGGPADDDIVQRVEWAFSQGFAGYCIGRSIFNSRNPIATLERLATVR